MPSNLSYSFWWKEHFSPRYVTFWLQAPALLAGLFFFFGLQWGGSGNLLWLSCPSLLLACSLFTSSNRLRSQVILCSFLFLATGFWGKQLRLFPETLHEGMSGKAVIELHQVSHSNHRFGNGVVFRGQLRSFENSKGELFHPNTPLIMFWGKASGRPLAGQTIVSQGRLLSSSRNWGVVWKPHSSQNLLSIKGKEGWGEWRFKNKKKLKSLLQKSISNPRARHFLEALLTGELQDLSLQADLSRMGLQHLLVISGFHFALLAHGLLFLLRFFFSPRKRSLLLILLLSLYAFFIGTSPSVLRAWFMTLITLGSYLYGRPAIALNSLGVALLLFLLWDPWASAQMGFVLSFLATGGILLIYPSLAPQPQKKLEYVLKAPPWEQWAYLLVLYLKKAFALSLSIHLATLPVLLLITHHIPLLSAFWNLFLPLLVGLGLMLLMIGLGSFFLYPPLGSLILFWNGKYMEWILRFWVDLPLSVHWTLPFDQVTPTLCTCTLLTLLLWGISRQPQKNTEGSWTFI